MASPSDTEQGDCPSCRRRELQEAASPSHSNDSSGGFSADPTQTFSSASAAPPSRTDSPSATFHLNELLNELSLSNPIHHDLIKGSEIYRIAQQVDARLAAGEGQNDEEVEADGSSDHWPSDRSDHPSDTSPRAANLALSVRDGHGRTIKKLPSRTLSPATASVALSDNVPRGSAQGLGIPPSTIPPADHDDEIESDRSEGIDSAGNASGTTDETTWKSPLVTTGSTTPDVAQKEVMQGAVAASVPSSHPLKFSLPASRHSSSSSVLLDSCNMLMPFWPKDAFSQELALLNVGGFTGAEILSEITEEAAAAAQDARFARRGASSDRHVAGSHDRHHHHQHDHYDHDDVHQVTSIDRFGGTTGWMEPCSNNKKRKSRRSEVDDIGGGGVGHAMMNSNPRRFNATTGARGRYGVIPEGSSIDGEAEADDDEVERPDVSSSTFRASRLVDEDEMGDEEQHHHHGHRGSDTSPISTHRLEYPPVRPPWSSAFRRQLRSDIKLRLSIKRARDAWWKKMKIKQEQEAAEQQDQERGGKNGTGAAKDSTSADGTASSAPPPPKPRKASKAEKRAQALRNKGGGSGAGQKKLTLADIRARAAGASSSSTTASKPEPARAAPAKEEQQDEDKEDEKARQPTASSLPAPPSRSPSPSPSPLAPPTSTPSLPTSSTFDFTCASRITDVLTVARASVRSLLDESFDEVITRLHLPKIIDERWPSIGPTVWKSKTPMLWPGAEVPTGKYLPGTVSRMRGNEKKWVTRGQMDAAQKLVFKGSPIAKEKAADAQHTATAMDTANAGPLSRTQASAPASTAAQTKSPPAPKLSRRKKATMNNIHHISNYSPARAPGMSTSGDSSPPAPASPPSGATAATAATASAGPLTTSSSSSSYLFAGTDYICMFCEYELFYGEPPLFFRACSHRRRRVKEQRRRAKQRANGASGKAAGTSGGAGAGQDAAAAAAKVCTCESCGHHQPNAKDVGG